MRHEKLGLNVNLRSLLYIQMYYAAQAFGKSEERSRDMN